VTDRREKLLELLETSGRRLHALLYRLTLRADVAEELLQELMLRLLRSSGFERSESAEGYAVRVAVNLAFDWRRQRQRRPIDSDETAAVGRDCPSVDGLSRVLENEQLDAILTSLERLSAAQREVVVLHYLEEQSFDEIARRLNRTSHQVRALCHKGLQRLRAIHINVRSPSFAEERPVADEVRYESG
jgi:RNA polymerase sigma-70 factor (ECF subfamily)